MKKIIFSLTVVLTLASGVVLAQQPEPQPQDNNQEPAAATTPETPIDGIFKKEHIENQIPTSYASLREADVFYLWRVWRQIDLREKINLPLTWPKSRLIDVILDAVLAGELKAYDPNSRGTSNKGYVDDGDEFRVPMTPEQVSAIGARRDTQMIRDLNGEMKQTILDETFNRNDVVAYRLKEEWVFDRQRSIFEPRIIGIAPLALVKNSQGEVISNGALTPLFWIYFPEARNIFAKKEVFNRFNDGQRFSFDDFFIQRMFSSYITKESNAKNERVQDYVTGVDALYEADHIKQKLILYEHDLWEY